MATMSLEDVNKEIPKAPPEVYFQACKFISRRTVSLLREVPFQAPAVVGTGSLLFIRNRYFMVTAEHVWRAFSSENLIYINRLESTTHSYSIPKSILKLTSFADFGKTITAWSSDLVLLEIPEAIAKPLEATTHAFHAIALESPTPETLQHQPDYVATGTPGVLSHVEPGAPNVTYFELRAFWCHPVEYIEQDELDFLLIRPHQEDEKVLAKITDFRGMSGGGFWEVTYTTDENGKIDFEVRFLGVVFWGPHGEQLDPVLHCQGRKGLISLLKQLK